LHEDVRDLRVSSAQLRARLARVKTEVIEVGAAVSRVEMRIETFAERVEVRFDQITELLRSSFGTLDWRDLPARRNGGPMR
jgi:hypothetical protein